MCLYNDVKDVKLKRGDVFLSSNPMALGKIINAVQAFYARDKKSKYSHAGIILDPDGTTLEAVWTVKNKNLFDNYAGDEILIGRPITLTESDIDRGIKAIEKHKGQLYPFLRLFLFAIPPLVRRLPWYKLVCSELTCKYLNKAGLKDIVWLGKMPDDIDEIITYHRDFKPVFRGKNGDNN